MSHDQDELGAFSLQDLFRLEAGAQARILTDGLLAIERGAGDDATIESLMRAAHSIKGAAAIVGMDVVVQLAHGIEDAFVAAQRGLLRLSPARVDVLLAGVDLIQQCGALAEDALAGWLGQHAARIDAAMASIAQVAAARDAGAALPAAIAPHEPEPPQAQRAPAKN